MTRTAVTGIVLDESIEITVEELCDACAASNNWVVELVEEGVIEPVDPGAADWRFRGSSIRRAQVAMRLRRDLRVNTPGVALALDLLDEVRVLRERLKRLAAADSGE